MSIIQSLISLSNSIETAKAPSVTYLASDFAKVLLPAVISYLATRYSLMHPRRQAIKEKQFELVYLPLYQLTKQYLVKRPTTQDSLLLFTRKAEKLFFKNHALVFPKTLRLFDALKSELKETNVSGYRVANFEYQVLTDYEIMKRELGYPTDSIFGSLKRLNKLDKVFILVKSLFFVLFVLNLSAIFLDLLDGKILDSIFLCFSLAFLGVALYTVNYMSKH